MAQEIDGGIAYLRSLRRSVSPLAAAATGPARETGSDKHSGSGRAIADSGERFKGAEERRSPRDPGEGSAELREEGWDVRTWATFSDVRLHGCYVEAQATYPAGTMLPF